MGEGATGSAGRVVIGTVKGDLHDISKGLVIMMLEGSGLEVIDLGVDVPPQGFATAAREHQTQILGMSSLLTTTMPGMAATIEELQEQGIQDQVRIITGGAPVTQALADKIDADGYSPNAAAAVRLAKSPLV